MQDERSYRTRRRCLVIGMCIGYLGCLLTLWYIWYAPRQWFDTFWLHIAANRFTLILIPLIIFCACYFKLLCMSGDMLSFRDRQLDERQRMVRDSAHRTAYKIMTLLCLLIPLYLAAQDFFASKSAPAANSPDHITVNRPVIAYAQHVTFILINQPGHFIKPITEWLIAAGNNPPVGPVLNWQMVFWRVPSAPAAPIINPPNPGIYYCLVLLTLLLIVCTLPRAIVAWKEF